MMKTMYGAIGARNTSIFGALTLATVLLWGGGAVSGDNPRAEMTDEQPRAEFSSDDSENRVVSVEDRFLGRAPWICTPSGFGQTASCFRRSAFR